MEHIREEHLEEKIVEHFKSENVFTVVLAGKAGIGKSWMARKVSLRVLKEDLFHISLWVYMSVKQSQSTLYHNIANQLSLTSALRELEIYDNEMPADMVGEGEDLEVLKNKILKRLSQHSLLLILDDEGKKMKEEDKEINDLLQFFSGNAFKVLVTSVNDNGRHKTEAGKIVIDLKPLSPEKSLSLFQEKAGPKIFEIPGAKLLVEDFIKRNSGLSPAEVVTIAKLVSYDQHDSGVQGLKRILEEVFSNDNKLVIPLSSGDYSKVPGAVLLDFSCRGSHFFRDRGAIHYSELIAYLIMEGYLGDIRNVEEAYEKAHSVLMELMDLQILKKVDTNYFVMENLILNTKDCYRCGFGGTASLGLAKVFDDANEWHGFGDVAEADGVIKAFGAKRKGGKHSTLFLDGNYLSRQDPEALLQSEEELQILGLFHPTIKYLPQFLSEKKNLNVLVLRDCDYLDTFGYIRYFRKLTVLEISDARSLINIPNDIFSLLTMLRSLNLSALQIERLPTSVYGLTELRWLILKGCSKLKGLKSNKRWRKLEVLNLSGAVSLKNIAETSLKSLPKLQFLDFSNSSIRVLPFLRENGELSHISVSGCRNLNRLPSIQSLTKLQVLDLSGARVKEIQDQSFLKNSNLEILDLSGTAISSLPSNLSIRYFYLKDCGEIKNINCFESPEKLEILDFSGASSLVNIEVKFFERMKNLKVLNLSRTKVKVLPPLSNLHNLRQLLLSCCLDLVELPSLNLLCKLEVLNLSGCRSMTMVEDKTFEYLSCLQKLGLSETSIEVLPELRSLSNMKELNLCGVRSMRRADFLEQMTELLVLDLSETAIEKLPSMSCFETLTHLSLRNCRQIDGIPNLEKFTKLEVLDLSGTSLRYLPSLKNLRNLHTLLIKDCLGLKELTDFQTLNLSEMAFGDLPFGISELAHLRHLALPNIKYAQGSEGKKIGSSMERPEEHHWAISSLTRKHSHTDRLVSLSGSEFLELLKQNHSSWETNFKDFHFSVHPIEQQNGIGGIYFHRDEYRFRDMYFQSRHLPHSEGQLHLLEIHGFNAFPKGIENVLRLAKYIFFVDNLFMRSLADLGTDNLKTMKGCWMERCQKMESLMDANSVGEFIELGKNLEILWISYALNLRSLCIENLQSDCFQNLKYLHLDCCPGLSRVFSSSQFPQNLEILHIEFCDRIETLFDTNSEKNKVLNLHTLRLWEMADLKDIGCNIPNLRSLEVGNCPMLEHVLSSTSIPEYLKVLKVKFCDNLHTLLEGLTRENHKLPSLQTVQLWGLPKLTNIGIDLTSLPGSSIRECPRLQIHVP